MEILIFNSIKFNCLNYLAFLYDLYILNSANKWLVY